jgi:hypothetical protein
MSLGYVGHARLEAEDTEITIYSYTGENWNVRDEEMRKRLESTNGQITIDKSCLMWRIVFGAEPSEEEILRFVVSKWEKLSFFGGKPAEASKPARNPKRRAREAAKALKRPAVSTKAQQALAAQREAMKQESAHARSRRRAEEADARFKLCFRERGCACPSFYDYAKSLRECRWGLAVQTGNFPPRRPYGPRRVRNRNKRWEALSGSPGSIGPFSSDRFAREVEQAVAVVPVLRPACLDLDRDTVGERFR